MDAIVKILIERDELTKAEAIERLQEVESMIDEAIAKGGYIEAEEIFTEELGLEIDYLLEWYCY